MAIVFIQYSKDRFYYLNVPEGPRVVMSLSSLTNRDLVICRCVKDTICRCEVTGMPNLYRVGELPKDVSKTILPNGVTIDNIIPWGKLTTEESSILIRNRTEWFAQERWMRVLPRQNWDIAATVTATVTFGQPRFTYKEVMKPLIKSGKHLGFKRVFWVIEDHKDPTRGKHAHGVIQLADSSSTRVNEFEKNLSRLGRSTVEPIRSFGNLSRYVSKDLPNTGDFYQFPGRSECWNFDVDS